MTSETQLAVAREYFQKAYNGQVSEAVKLLDPAVTYYVPGSSRMSGRFEGAEAVSRHTAELLRLTNQRVEILKWEDWLVGVNHVALVMQLRLQRPNMVQTSRIIQLVSMSADDKIREIELFFADEASVERFFSPVIQEGTDR
jgi:ketosteroid isomerase-like protein